MPSSDKKTKTCPFSVPLYRYSSLFKPCIYDLDTCGTGRAGPISFRSVKSLKKLNVPATGERMRKGKKALLIAAAMIFTIATLAVLNFVRSKMQADEESGKTAAALVLAGDIVA